MKNYIQVRIDLDNIILNFNLENELSNGLEEVFFNVLYKICSRCVCFRIKKVLDYLISDTLSGFMVSGFMKGMYIGENTRFIYDPLSNTKFKNIPGSLVLIDF